MKPFTCDNKITPLTGYSEVYIACAYPGAWTGGPEIAEEEKVFERNDRFSKKTSVNIDN